MKVLVTGAAGFIGMHVSQRLLQRGDVVVGIDNLNDYYDIRLKQARLDHIASFPAFHFIKMDLKDRSGVEQLFNEHSFDAVINLAAQAGVRYSLENPHAYIDSNIVGFMNLLESCRTHSIGHLVYASSSSVYGLNSSMPFSVHDNVDHPISLYAASKKSNELMAHTYSHLYGLPTTGLRFFTVYGPWGRPDMALYLFAKAISTGQPIKVFNNGEMQRDFTYIDDIVEGIIRVTDKPPSANTAWSSDSPDPSSSPAPYRLFNIGNNQPVKLLAFIEAIESAMGRKATKQMMPIQPGDVEATYADIDDLVDYVDYRPDTSIEHGIKEFVSWFKAYED